MFAPASHPYVGTTRVFIPQGWSPYAPATAADLLDPDLLLPAGDAVDVLSAWSRPYLPADAPLVLYVRSHATGRATHVVEAELPLGAAELGAAL